MGQSEWNGKLIFAVVSAALGSGFSHGFHGGIVNTPEAVLKSWVNETVPDSAISITFLYSILTTIMNLGGILGGMVCGTFANFRGPRTCLVFNNIIAAVGCACMGLSKSIGSYEVMVVGRFVIGINCGINAGVCPMYLSEISPTPLRGAIGSCYQLVIVISILLSQILGIRHVLGTDKMWPILFFIPLIFAVIQVVGLMFCVESPKYLAAQEKTERAEQALKWLRKTEDVGTEMAQIKAEDAEIKSLPKIKFKDMFKEKYLRTPLMISVMMMVGQQFSGVNAIIFYSTDTFKTSAKLDADEAAYGTIGIGLVNLGMTLVALYLVDKAGRKTLLLVGFSGMAIVQVLMTIFCQFRETHISFGYIVIFLVVVYIMIFATGAGPIPWFLVSEIFNQAARPIAASIAVPTNWFCNFIVGLIFLPIQDAIGAYAFLIFVVCNVLMFLYTWRVVPETKNRDVDEIVQSFK